MLEENNIIEEENFYLENFRERWNKVCKGINKYLKNEKIRDKKLGPVVINRASSHGLNYLRRINQSE